MIDIDNINIFYHLYAINDAESRFFRTYNKIVKSGLIDKIKSIRINIVGPNKQYIYNHIHTLDKTVCSVGNNSKNESETLNVLLDYCIQNPIGYSLYLHSKGVKRILEKNICKDCIQDWIDCMEYFLIEEHDIAINYLRSVKTCGINLVARHYSGNFWWARNDYIKTRPRCIDNFMYCELSFLNVKTNRPKRYKNLHTTPVMWPNWRTTRYPRDQYTNKPPLIENDFIDYTI